MKKSPDPPPSIERHSRKCAICTHPDRQAIDEAFLHWSRNDLILKKFNLSNLSSLYRHAYATGLRQARNSNRESNREHEAPPQEANSNRESSTAGVPAGSFSTQWQSRRSALPERRAKSLEPAPPPNLSNRENDAWFSGTTSPQTMTAEIQRMLIGK